MNAQIVLSLACSLSLLTSCGGIPRAQGAINIQTKVIKYQAGGGECHGYLAWDANQQGPRPGVLVVHEWWGHNDYAQRRARMLAAMGYTALALDMYGEGKTAAHPKDAGKFMNEALANMPTAVERFTTARRILEAHDTTDPQKTAAIGYCFGGGVVLHMARMGMDLDGVASFHGSLATKTPAKPGSIHAAVFVAHGTDDAMVPAAQVAAFKQEMVQAGAELSFYTYPGAKHGFTNPAADAKAEKFNIPLGYDAHADQASWGRLRQFLGGIWR